MHDLIATIDGALATWGPHPVLIEVDGNGTITPIPSSELLRRIDGAEHSLRRFGVQRYDVVALFLENSADYIAVLIALWRLGAIPVFAKLEYRRNELTTIFRDIDPDGIITEEHYLPHLKQFYPGRGIIVRRPDGLAAAQPVTRHHVSEETVSGIASINCTYRGCGELLGSMATERQYLHGAKVLQDGLQGNAGESMLYPLPLSHIFTLIGCLLVPLMYGMTGVITRTVHPRVLFDTIHKLEIRHMTAVPEIYRLLARSFRSKRPPESLKTFVSGGSTLEAGECRNFNDIFEVEVLHGFGLTEFTPVSRNVRNESRCGTVGPVCDGVEVSIANPDDEGKGEILVKSDALGLGYYNRPQATRQAFRDGWFHTGDRGFFDGDHLVFDREIKATGKINGVMVDREEIRRTILAATPALDAEVRLQGNSILALLELPEDADIEGEQKRLHKVLPHQLAAYKIPRRLEQRVRPAVGEREEP